jgi:hypothetical protein
VIHEHAFPKIPLAGNYNKSPRPGARSIPQNLPEQNRLPVAISKNLLVGPDEKGYDKTKMSSLLPGYEESP